MNGRIEFRDGSAEGAGELADPGGGAGRGRGCGRQVPGGGIEQVGAGVLDSARLRTGERMTPDEARIADRLNHRALGRSHVRHHDIVGGSLERCGDQSHERADGGCDEHRVRVRDRGGEAVGAMIDGAAPLRGLHRSRIEVPAGDLGAHAFMRRQRDRAPDQSQADDGDAQAFRSDRPEGS